jgi:uncharacterized protein
MINRFRCSACLAGIGAIALILCCTSASKTPSLAGRINDFASVLTADERASLEREIIQFENSSGAILVMVTVTSYQPFPSISAFSAELFKNHGRGIGDATRNNGLLVVLAVRDLQVRITTGIGMEEVVTDRVATDVVQQMTPDFRRGAYGQGLRSGLEALRRVFQEYHVP